MTTHSLTMLRFIKKYSLAIIFIALTFVLGFFVIPAQEDRYLAPDLLAMEKWSRSVVLWAVAIMAGVIFIIGLRYVKRVKEVFNLLLGLSWIALGLFFLFNYIIIAAIFFLNQLSGGNVEKIYTVTYVNQQTKLLLLRDDITMAFSANELLNGSASGLKKGDKVTVSFSKGLFGFNFDPVIKTSNP